MQAVYHDGSKGEETTVRGAEMYVALMTLLADARVAHVKITRHPRPETWRRVGKKSKRGKQYF